MKGDGAMKGGKAEGIRVGRSLSDSVSIFSQFFLIQKSNRCSVFMVSSPRTKFRGEERIHGHNTQ